MSVNSASDLIAYNGEDALSEISIRPKNLEDSDWIEQLLVREWGSKMIVSRGILHDATGVPAFIAKLDGKPVGLATYRFDENQCELLTLNSERENLGVGTALVNAVSGSAREKNCKRLWLITSNDNLNAVRFYQKRGFALACVHRNAMHLSRKLKPSIPEIGIDGIPLRDEIEMELLL